MLTSGPTLAVFGKAITPNFHRIAAQFVTLDNFTDPGDGSMDGWSWSLQGRVTNTQTLTQQLNYAFVNRGLSYDSEGSNRNVPVNLPTVPQRDAATSGLYTKVASTLPGGPANLLPGNGDHSSSDAPFGKQLGYIFDAVLDAGGTVRNYGFLANNVGPIVDSTGAAIQDPFAANAPQVVPVHASLVPYTDVYFRDFDQAYPDLWRYNEWKREFDGYVANGNLPNLTLLRLSHDHTGSFSTALAGVNTPETQQADNDYSVAKVLEALAGSPYANDTVVFITEDDCQDGPDHVDSHRATAYVAGAYVKQGAVVSTPYTQVNVLRTIEAILGTKHLNLNTASFGPMTDVFDIGTPSNWTFTALASTYLSTTTLSLARAGEPVRFAAGPLLRPKHDAQYWASATAGFDFSDADRVPVARFNHVLWDGLMDGKPYPGPVGMTSERDDD